MSGPVSVVLVSHGETPVAQISGVFERQGFMCPNNICINLFETMGKFFHKNDGGLLTNLMSQINPPQQFACRS